MAQATLNPPQRSRRANPARRTLGAVWSVVKASLAVAIVWNLISLASSVAQDNGDTMSEKAATWGRDHHLGSAIDWLEAKIYSDPPSKQPAQQLALAGGIGATPPASIATAATVTGATTTSAPGTGTEASVAATAGAIETSTSATPPPVATTAAAGPTPATATAATAATAATVAVAAPTPVAPAPITPIFAPALAGEGQWVPIASAGGHDAMWATSVRPLASAGGVVATMVEIDQTYLRAGMFNGSEVPGGGPWKRGNRVPNELQPSLLAAFNGGFRFEHFKGGYVTEGVVVKPLRTGDATLAINAAGQMKLGVLGRDIFDDGSWISIRQNLIPIVDGGQSQVQKGIREGVWWGADFGKEVYVPRSAVCTMPDGRLAYALVSIVDAQQLADSLIAMGCVTAIQLDINGTWPAFFTFGRDHNGNLVGRPVDNRMGGNPYRYLSGSTKEFFAFFDAARVPAGSVLDS